MLPYESGHGTMGAAALIEHKPSRVGVSSEPETCQPGMNYTCTACEMNAYVDDPDKKY